MTTSLLYSPNNSQGSCSAGRVSEYLRDVPHLLKFLVSPGEQREMEHSALIIFFQAISGTIFSVTVPAVTFIIMS